MKQLIIRCLIGSVISAGGNTALGKDTDCSVARDPRRCAALQTAREACSVLQGQARSACIHEAMPPPDCRHAPNQTQCEASQAAAQACKDKHGKARRKCLREKAKGIQ